ncbi:MAG TPA: response regulator [Polyangiales bacterium]|nr:response regulator [Polyangiales bacterium]
MLPNLYASGYQTDKNSPRNHVSSPQHKALSSARIAIIDDDDEIRDALEQLLRSVGYEIIGYDRADRALIELETGEAPDLIVLDLLLPGMNGWHFRIEQKKCPKLRDVPVIALSADASPYAKAVDADAYVSKPVDVGELEAVIGRVLLANERRRLLAKSMELERIRALGTLVSSVAHEINNPLTYVIGCIELASCEAKDLENGRGVGVGVGSALSGYLADAADGAARIASVVQLLSTFSRADANDGKDIDVLRAVQAASRLAQHQISRNARFEEKLAPVPRVIGNEGRLAQVVLNLLVNAAQAVSSSGEGNQQLVRVATRLTQGSVVIEVSDTGPGIEPKLLEQIFEPFFTTKPAGMGTGLGLSISRDIISGMGGTLTVHSVLGRGATFLVTLPIAGGFAQAPDQEGTATESSSGVVRRILVIDDEPMIGRLVQSVLSLDAVEVSPLPREALKLVADRTYDVILCDFSMPDMSGLEFYRKLIELRPELQTVFILMTGFHNNAEISAFARTQQLRLLYKPFSIRELHQCLSFGDVGHAEIC